jgi:signal transduction histidine kinase
MLDEFVVANREEIIARTRARVASRTSPKASDVELTNGIPIFLDQLCKALRLADTTDVIDHAQINESAGRHGHDLQRMGLTIAQVVHDYGDVCQTITALAVEQKAPIPAEEFRTLNLCLDDAIAEAVTQFASHKERAIASTGTERLGFLAHELRNLLQAATISFESLKSGRVAIGGSTGEVLGRSLIGLGRLIDRSLAEVRLDAGIDRKDRISVAVFLEEIEVCALMQEQAHGVHLVVAPVDPGLMIQGDRPTLAAAISNLLQNAFKFTKKNGHVSLTTRVSGDRVLFEIEDECGGLPPGRAEELFRPFEQRSTDRSGVGLGLAISRRAARANAGEIHVRDVPGKGCVFTLDLPKLVDARRAAF